MENIFTRFLSRCIHFIITTHARSSSSSPLAVTVFHSPSLSRCIRGMRGISINSRNQKRRSGRGCALCAPLPPPLRSTVWTDTPSTRSYRRRFSATPMQQLLGFVMLKCVVICRPKHKPFPVFSDCILLIYDTSRPIPVAAPSKAWVCGRSLAEIAGSNLARGAWMSLSCECLCIVR